ncbi:diaminopimelate decarboxylase [Campylobacter corcagiensis]|uniref:Diaminopimelate decarboxylase n=1 Tax=Campylobacter corcagiensis TaxID=1448857 RepID=A0A7M1LID5_9BACT|nr:diaminopimelate decarboxylase [Campylobacter corcagiensis]QKF64079.1 diaminopimelate decarboxylase [Campylobacter corcagiensis]QOQ87724.1 diaminopimelate decarboxylase [Campylobacter corcagiensis]
MDYQELKNIYDTPLYVYNFDDIKSRYEALKSEFKARKSLICYAVKANSNLSLLKMLADLGSGFDCVSIGEVKRAILAGAKSYKIIFSGVGKKDSEIKEAINLDILMINVESSAELLRVESVAKELNKKARISIRVNPNIDAKTHPYISTGLKENKFGVDIEKAKSMYLKAKNSSFLDPVGIHFHIGSQLLDITPVHEAAKVVAKLLNELKAVDIDIKFFDVGGGIGIRYNKEEPVNLYQYAQGILESLKGQDLTIVCEPGRYIVGECGELLTSVIYEKINDKKRFVIVDAAMNDLLRPSLYGAYHEILSLKNTQTSNCDVVGPVCESGDFLAKDINLPDLESGDLLVVKNAGAYGFTMSSNYNTRARAAEVAIEAGKHRLIRKRESFEDLIKNELVEDFGAKY